MKQAILYRARKVEPVVQREVGRLCADLPEVSVFVVCYHPEFRSDVDSIPGSLYLYGQRDLHRLPYPNKLCQVDWDNPTRRPNGPEQSERFLLAMEYGHQDLPVLKFFLDHPEFEHYWLIEDDVRWSGSWADIFAELSNSSADLLATAVQNYSEEPGWYWWKHVETGTETLPIRLRVKGFFPFCRLSRAFLGAVDQKYRQGWGGHYEVSWPSIARCSTLSIEDIGGHGTFTPPERRGRFYTCTTGTPYLFPGTFVYRPAFRDTGVSEFGKGVTPDCMLWHPVKT